MCSAERIPAFCHAFPDGDHSRRRSTQTRPTSTFLSAQAVDRSGGPPPGPVDLSRPASRPIAFRFVPFLICARPITLPARGWKR